MDNKLLRSIVEAKKGAREGRALRTYGLVYFIVTTVALFIVASFLTIGMVLYGNLLQEADIPGLMIQPEMVEANVVGSIFVIWLVVFVMLVMNLLVWFILRAFAKTVESTSATARLLEVQILRDEERWASLAKVKEVQQVLEQEEASASE